MKRVMTMALEKARIINTEKDGKTIEVMFNPPSMSISSSNSYADLKSPGSNQEKQQFIKNNSDVLSVELFFDTTRTNSEVRDVVNPIIDLARVRKGAKEPPKLIFAWGAYVFDCVIISIDQTYDYFNSSGQALRATLKMKFRRVSPEDESDDAAPAKTGAKAVNAAKKAAKKTASKVVVQPNQNITCFCSCQSDWRPIAVENKIPNPHLISTDEYVGKELLVCSEENMSYSSNY